MFGPFQPGRDHEPVPSPPSDVIIAGIGLLPESFVSFAAANHPESVVDFQQATVTFAASLVSTLPTHAHTVSLSPPLETSVFVIPIPELLNTKGPLGFTIPKSIPLLLAKSKDPPPSGEYVAPDIVPDG